MRRSPKILLYLLIPIGLLTRCHCFHPPPLTTIHITYPSETLSPFQLDPAYATDEKDLKALHFLSRGLLRTETDFGLTPELAESYLLSPEDRTITFILKPNLFWSDGIPLRIEHVRDGIVRNLEAPNTNAPVVIFRSLLDVSCQEVPASCLKTQGNALIVQTRTHPAHVLPFFAHPCTFPIRKDSETASNPVSYFSPLHHPTLGPYRLTRHTPYVLELTPLHPDFFPVSISHVPWQSDWKKKFHQGKVHLIESVPLQLLNDPNWEKHIRAFSDFNVLIMREWIAGSERRLADIFSPNALTKYLQEKGLPMVRPPVLLEQLITSCAAPWMTLHSSHQTWGLPIHVFGPKDLFAFLAAEHVQKQLHKINVHAFRYFPVSQDYISLVSQQRSPRVFSLLRTSVPSLLTLFSTSLSALKNAKYYQDLSPDELLRSLCHNPKEMTPLVSLPLYVAIHPKISSFTRDGKGVYRFFRSARGPAISDLPIHSLLAAPKK